MSDVRLRRGRGQAARPSRYPTSSTARPVEPPARAALAVDIGSISAGCRRGARARIAQTRPTRVVPNQTRSRLSSWAAGNRPATRLREPRTIYHFRGVDGRHRPGTYRETLRHIRRVCARSPRRCRSTACTSQGTRESTRRFGAILRRIRRAAASRAVRRPLSSPLRDARPRCLEDGAGRPTARS